MGKREARSPQGSRARRELWWRGVASGSTMNTRKLRERMATKASGKLLAAILAGVLGALALTGCSAPRQNEGLLPANIGWDGNGAVSNPTKGPLEDELYYESVEISTSDDHD